VSRETESELLRRAKSGDRAAFDTLRKVLEPPVLRFARNLVGYSETEEDVLQNAFIALWVNLARIDPVERLRPFLFRIVRNLCYDELRRRGRFRAVSLDTGWEEPAEPDHGLRDPRPPPDEEVQRILLIAEVQRAMQRLPELQRQALILHAIEDLPYAEVAVAMDTDIGTVKSRIHYARRNLQRLLRPDTKAALGLTRE
jgi:RNA polymerase sigma-70 factor (ECF subfamily)